MLLLKQEKKGMIYIVLEKFTFQYASIKTKGFDIFGYDSAKIYISICFY